jgi:hypothetical protein
MDAGSLRSYRVSVAGGAATANAIVGDVNGDGDVNCADLAIVRASFGKSVGQPGFDPRADLNADGIVNIIDLSTISRALPAGLICK